MNYVKNKTNAMASLYFIKFFLKGLTNVEKIIIWFIN